MMHIRSNIRSYNVYFSSKFKFNNSNKTYYIVDDFFFRKKIKNLKLNYKNTIFVKANETSKSYENISPIITALLSKKIDKSSTIVCIGGGTIQDISSFISFIIFRGINWFFVPTTLLAQADSCIGSKIAINLKNTKNVLGGYWPANKIFISDHFLKSLPKIEIYSGFGEMAHYFYLSTKKDYLFFKNTVEKMIEDKQFAYKELIQRSLYIKKKFIEKDEFERKERIFLNYGHTFGHAIESTSNFKIPHGIAVSIGMHIANYISYKIGYIDEKQLKDYQDCLEKIFISYKKYFISPRKLFKAILQDKKTLNNKIRIILIKKIGKPSIKVFSSNITLLNLLKDYFEYKKLI